MNTMMKKITVASLMCLSFVASADEIVKGGNEFFDLADYQTKSVFVTFENSKVMTDYMKDRFSGLGFTVADSEEAADLSLRMMGAYIFQKPHAKKNSVDIGKVVDEGDKNVSIKRADESPTHVTNLNILQSGLNGNLSANMVLGVGIVDTVLQMVGVRSWFNKLVAGDERGFCVGTTEMCKDWKKYMQDVRLIAIASPKGAKQVQVRANAATKDEQLIPAQLFELSMQELTARLFPGQVPASNPKVDPARAEQQPVSQKQEAL